MGQARRIKRVILHAGLPKTATTSIQNALFGNARLLRDRNGILYPGPEANHTDALCTAFLDDPRRHITNALAGLTDLTALRNLAAAIRERLRAEIEASRADTVLFSAEGFSNLDEFELAGFRDWALGFAETLSVLFVVREPLRHTTSVIQQHLKGGEVLEALYDAPPLPNFRGRLGAAIRAFGREAITVAAFETLQAHDEGVVGGFLDLVGISSGPARRAVLSAQRVENASLSHLAALLLSSINRQRPALIDGRPGPRRTMSELATLGGIRGEKFRLPPEVAARIAESCRDDAAWLRQTFGIADYDDPAVPDAPAPAAPAAAAIDSLALILSNLMNDRHATALIGQAGSLDPERQRVELAAIAETVGRIAPERALPGFLADAVLPRQMVESPT